MVFCKNNCPKAQFDNFKKSTPQENNNNKKIFWPCPFTHVSNKRHGAHILEFLLGAHKKQG